MIKLNGAEKGPTNKCRRNNRIRDHHLATVIIIIDGIDFKTSGWIFDEKEDTCIFSRHLHPSYLLVTKEKTVTLQWKDLAAQWWGWTDLHCVLLDVMYQEGYSTCQKCLTWTRKHQTNSGFLKSCQVTALYASKMSRSWKIHHNREQLC